MTDSSANGGVRDEPVDSSKPESNLDENDVVRRGGPWVSFYGFLHEHVGHRTVVFGGSGVVGALVLVRQFYAFTSDPMEWSGLPSWTVVIGVLLFGFGVGYYVVRDDTACSKCGEPFSKKRVGKRPISKECEADGRDRLYVEQSYECRSCGETSSELFSRPQWGYPRC